MSVFNSNSVYEFLVSFYYHVFIEIPVFNSNSVDTLFELNTGISINYDNKN